MNHKSLKIFDLSFNSIGSGIKSTPNQSEDFKKIQQYAMSWKECFEHNTSLMHVDLRHNNLNSQEIEIISQGLANNHTILAIHLLGNEGEADTQGFVKINKIKQVSTS